MIEEKKVLKSFVKFIHFHKNGILNTHYIIIENQDGQVKAADEHESE